MAESIKNQPRTRSPWKKRLAFTMVGICTILLLLVVLIVSIEWRPDPIMETPVLGRGSEGIPPPAEIALQSWNIGYAGLGKDADFFMDGGKQVRPPRDFMVQENLVGILDFLKKETADILLIQEVDSQASRTFGINEVSAITALFPQYFYARALNFKSPWVPYPILNPIGRVESGLLSLSRFRPTSARRYQLPGRHPWPVRVFHLKRCIHELRFPAPDGKDWIVLHLHLSAFDEAGDLRKEQMKFLREMILELHQEGHHVIVGGDWNQAFPDVSDRQFHYTEKIPDWYQRVPAGWTPPGWKWGYDPSVPSLRATNKPYVPGENFLTIIDGFLVSPEIQIDSVKTFDLGFVNSDHQPVKLRVSLRP